MWIKALTPFKTLFQYFFLKFAWLVLIFFPVKCTELSEDVVSEGGGPGEAVQQPGGDSWLHLHHRDGRQPDE
jgi:hypothetical protein